MFAMLVGLRHKLLHQVVLLHLALTAEADNAVAVVVLGLVVHLVVHASLLGLQGFLRETHRVEQLCHRQFGHLLQRVEDVHHLQVLLRSLVEVLGVDLRLVGGRIMVGFLRLQLSAQVGQLMDKDGLHQRQQGHHLGIGQVVFLALLHLRQVAEQQGLVHMVVAPAQIALQQLPQHLEATFLHFPLSTFHRFQVHLQHLLLLANHIVVVQHPLVGAAHQPLALGLLDQQHIIVRNLLYTDAEYVIYTFHANINKKQKCKDMKKI